MSYQGQTETVREKLEGILRDVPGATGEFQWRNFRQLTVMYLCTAEDQEEECAGFIPGANGECCFKVMKDGMKTCEWREI